MNQYVQRLHSVITILKENNKPCSISSLQKQTNIPTSAMYRLMFDLRRFKIIDDVGKTYAMILLKPEFRRLKDSEIEKKIISHKLLFRNGKFAEKEFDSMKENEEFARKIKEEPLPNEFEWEGKGPEPKWFQAYARKKWEYIKQVAEKYGYLPISIKYWHLDKIKERFPIDDIVIKVTS